MRKFLVILFIFCMSCSDEQGDNEAETKQKNCVCEKIERKHNEFFAPIITPKLQDPPQYPWEKANATYLPRITKEFFRCKGSHLNPVRYEKNAFGDMIAYSDCLGRSSHGLPLIHGQEKIYPILVELLNHLQQKTKKRVIITCGHRCPQHNTYADASKRNQTSKHMIGAEVDFYVEGYEYQPKKVVDMILEFYQTHPRYKQKKEFATFERYRKETNVATLPWFNKEIFLKLYMQDEGRDFDNRHPYPYIGLQVRYDRDLGQQVAYEWEKAHKGYVRQ